MSEKITTCLILNGAAASAANFYTSVFERSRVRDVMRAPPGGFLPEGDVLAVTLELAGREMMIINRGPEVAPNDAMSLVAHCADQAEIDRLWSALTEGGVGEPVRLAQGPVRRVLADRAGEHGRAHGR